MSEKQFKDVIDRQNIFVFHRILSSFYLEGYKDGELYENYKDNCPDFESYEEYMEFISLLQRIINYYFLEFDKKSIESNEKLKDLKDKERKLEKLRLCRNPISMMGSHIEY